MSVVAVDIGSSRIKAVLADWDGRTHAERIAATPRQALEPGEQAYPAAAVLGAVEELIADLARAHARDPVETIVFSCLGTAVVPLDGDGIVLGPALAPADRRPLAVPTLVDSLELDDDELRRRCGSDPTVASSLWHILWWRREHPGLMDRVRRFRSLRGYALERLCGVDAEDRSWASRTMLFDLEHDGWSSAVLAAAGLPADILPPLAPSTSAWVIEPAASERLGVSRRATVVLGAMDNCCSMLGATTPGGPALVNIVGTFEHMAGVTDLERARQVAAATGAVIHRYLLAEGFICMSRVLLGELLTTVANGSPGGLAPLLAEVSPEPRGGDVALRPEAIRSALAAGMPRVDVLQAVLEAAVAVLADFVAAWPDAGPADGVAVVGGGSEGEAVLQLKANLLRRRLSTLASSEAAVIGALRIGAMAVRGLSLDEACALFANPIRRTLEPWSTAPASAARSSSTAS